MTARLTLTLDIKTAESMSISQDWRGCVALNGPLVLLSGHVFRARPTYKGQAFWGIIRSWRIHPDALALGILTVHHDASRWIYLSGVGSMVTAETPILIVEVEE